MRGKKGVGLALLLGGAVAGCVAMAPGPRAAPAVGQAAPPVEGEDADGRPLRLRDYAGQVVLLHFWHGG